MLRAHLHGCLNVGPRMPVIDRDHVAALQVFCDLTNPVKRYLIKASIIVQGTVEENELIAVESNEFFPTATDQTHWHCVEQFIREMHANEWLQRTAPIDLVVK